MKVSAAATVFQVKDLEAALNFYCALLAFEKDFTYVDYAGVHLGEFYLHLCAHNNWRRPVGGGAVVIFADEIDAYFVQIKERGVEIRLEPSDQPYGMREFAVSDPDGNVLTFSRPLQAS